MKISFTLLQTALTTVFVFLFCVCIGADYFALTMGMPTVREDRLVCNAVICAAALVVSLIFVLRPSLTHMSGGGDCGDPVPVLSAARTYVCFVALDASVVMLLMLYGIVTSQNSAEYILITAPSVFLVGVVKYIRDIRKVGIAADDGDSSGNGG